MVRFERLLFLSWIVTCSTFYLSNFGGDLRETMNRSGFDVIETVNERSLVRTVVSPARELGNLVAVRETVTGVKIYGIEDGKYSIDFALSKSFSSVLVGESKSLKVSHAGNLYSEWSKFSDRSEIVAIVFQSSAKGNSKFVVKLRAPELFISEKILQFRASPCSLAEATTFSGFFDIGRLKQLDLVDSELIASELWFMP